jgi:hypothetical protein
LEEGVLEKAVWVLMEITSIKPTSTNRLKKRIYYEMCDSSREKVAGAITIPIPPNAEVPEFKTVILSTLDPSEAADILRNAGQQL